MQSIIIDEDCPMNYRANTNNIPIETEEEPNANNIYDNPYSESIISKNIFNKFNI